MPLTRMSLENRIQIIRLSSVYEKPSHLRLAWKKKFGTDPPSGKTIAAINKKFNETGSVADLNRSGRPKSSRAPNNVAIVEEAIKKDPTKSLRALSQDLGINRASIHRIKLDSESKKNFLQGENKLLKEKISELNKRIQLLENKGFSTNSKEGTFPRTATITLTGEEKSHDLLEDSAVGENKMIVEGNPTVITFTPVSNHSQVLHFPTDTYRIIEVQTAPQASQDMDASQVETIHNCSQEHPIAGCPTCSFLNSNLVC